MQKQISIENIGKKDLKNMKKYKIKKLIIDCTPVDVDGIQLIKIEYKNGSIPLVSKSDIVNTATEECNYKWEKISIKDILLKDGINPLPILDIQVGDMILKCNNCDK